MLYKLLRLLQIYNKSLVPKDEELLKTLSLHQQNPEAFYQLWQADSSTQGLENYAIASALIEIGLVLDEWFLGLEVLKHVDTYPCLQHLPDCAAYLSTQGVDDAWQKLTEDDYLKLYQALLHFAKACLCFFSDGKNIAQDVYQTTQYEAFKQHALHIYAQNHSVQK
jgi:hypothetical protein